MGEWDEKRKEVEKGVTEREGGEEDGGWRGRKGM